MLLGALTDDGEFEGSAFGLDEVPGGALGQGFGFGVRVHVGAGEVRPCRFGHGGFVRGGVVVAVADGRERGGHHDALHASRVAGRAEHTKGPLAGRDDQVVFVFGGAGRKGGGDVEHVGALCDGGDPAGVFGEVRDGEGEVGEVGGFAGGDHCADAGFAVGGADRGSDAIASGEAGDDAVGTEEAGAAGDEDEGFGFFCHV